MKRTLKKSDKLRLKSEFVYVRENGSKYVGRFMVLVSADSPDNTLRCGIICGKRFSKKAVDRNRARRLMWESFRLLKPQIKANYMILITRNWIKGKKQVDVENELRTLLKQAGRFAGKLLDGCGQETS